MEALWAPDTSFVIAAVAPTPDMYQGGAAQLVYTDGKKSVVSLGSLCNGFDVGP
jgi:hypothetical protein